MDKEDVLEKSRMDNAVSDEREHFLEMNGGMTGLLTVCAVAMIFGFIKTNVLGIPGNDLMAIAFLGMGASNTYQYVKSRRSINLTSAILFFFGATCFAISYFQSISGSVF